MPGGWTSSTRHDSLPRGWARLRAFVLIRDRHVCVGWRKECGATATTVDHVIPHHLGGSDDPANLASLCEDCHGLKSSEEGNAAQAARRADLKRRPERHPGIM